MSQRIDYTGERRSWLGVIQRWVRFHGSWVGAICSTRVRKNRSLSAVQTIVVVQCLVREPTSDAKLIRRRVAVRWRNGSERSVPPVLRGSSVGMWYRQRLHNMWADLVAEFLVVGRSCGRLVVVKVCWNIWGLLTV